MPPKPSDRPRSTKKEAFKGHMGSSTKRDLRAHRKTRFASDQQIYDIPGREVKVGFDNRGFGDKYGYDNSDNSLIRPKNKNAQFGKDRHFPEYATPKNAPPPAVPSFKEKGDALEARFRKMLEEMREDLKKGGPIAVTDSAPRDINTKDINGQLIMSGLKMSGFDEFMINKVQVPTPDQLKAGELWIKYEITVPHLHVAGKYDIEGTHKKVDVRGNGEFQGDVLFYKNIGHVTFEQAEDGALQVADYKLKIKSLGIDVQEKGLKFGILGSAELKPIIDNALHEYLQKYWKEASPKVAEKAKENLNAMLRRIHKERQEGEIKSKEVSKETDVMRKQREEELRKCREKIANRPNPRPPGYPAPRDQSLLGWLYPPKHPMM